MLLDKLGVHIQKKEREKKNFDTYLVLQTEMNKKLIKTDHRPKGKI